jgi:hypothetical protein
VACDDFGVVWYVFETHRELVGVDEPPAVVRYEGVSKSFRTESISKLIKIVEKQHKGLWRRKSPE